MKKLLTIIIAAVAVTTAAAQQFVIGSKMPELRSVKWLSKSPENGQPSYIEFYQSTNKSSVEAFPKLSEIKSARSNINIVVLVRETGEEIDKLVKNFGTDYAIGYDADGKTHDAFGVKFVPFGVLVDSRNTLQWQGNLSQFSTDQLKNVK